MAKKRVAVLISGRGSNLAALIAAAEAPDYPAEIVFVLSNRSDAGGIAFASQRGIATAVVDHARFGKDREAFEREMQAELERRQIDIVCLAGFMRLLTPWFVGRWDGRMINVHPALLPAFKGLDTHERGARGRRQDPRCHCPFRGAGHGCRPDHRPGRGSGRRGRHAR